MFPNLFVATKRTLALWGFRSSCKQFSWWQVALLTGLVSTAGASPTSAAELIYGSYAALERSISIDSLEVYAKEGKLDEDLSTYARYLNSQQLAQLRSALVARADLSPVAISQFLYTPIGETLLKRLGQLIQTEARQSGFYALRAALVLAAADAEGLTLLNVMRKFPTRGIRINLRRSLQVADQLESLINQTKQASTLIKQQSVAAATAQPLDFSQLPNLQQQGAFTWQTKTITLRDQQRKRTFVADIYLPSAKISPVIVISHGLGSDRNSFKYLAVRLASHGFAVAIPEHPGSNAQQLSSLLAGQTSTVAEPNEFVDRPLDVKYLLNQLELLDSSDSTFQLNLQQVGAIGQSLGAYTVLALAGATLNFDQLQQDCKKLNNSWNVSLFLQCRALELPRKQYNLQDQRVKAVIAINVFSSSIFGQVGLSKIQVPVMLISSSADTVTPALLEQMLPFTWLNTPNKYFILLQGGTHFSTIGESNQGIEPLAIPDQVIGPSPTLARRYVQVMSIAFFQTYTQEATQYQPYLSAAYAQVISRTPLQLSLVKSISIDQLTQSILPKQDD